MDCDEISKKNQDRNEDKKVYIFFYVHCGKLHFRNILLLLLLLLLLFIYIF